MSDNENVVTSDKFKMDDDALEHLKELGVKIHANDASDEDIDLIEPQRGEKVVGELNDVEWALYKEMHLSSQEFERQQREFLAQKISGVAEDMRSNQEMHEILQKQSGSAMPQDISDEDAESFFGLEQKINYVKAAFWFRVSERLGIRRFRAGVRSRRRVVTVEQRY